MTHTLTALLAFAICAALIGCEVVPIGTTAKLKALQKRARYHASKKKHHGTHRAAAAQGTAIVSPEWLGEYRNLEAEHGNYTIPDDHRIHVGPQGKIQVPQSVIKHFNDLSTAPTEPSE